MNGWRKISLGEAIDIFDHIRVPLSASERSTRKGIYPYYGAQSIIDFVDDYLFDGRYILVPEDGENLNSRKLPIAYFADGKFWVNNHAHIIRGKPELAHDVFLKHAISATDIKGYITGAAQPKLTQANLRRITMRLPDFATQSRIASILGAYDDLIMVNRRRIALLEAMARGLFEEWFVHFRFPGHETSAFVSTPLGSLPANWEVVHLEDMLVLQRGFDLPSTTRTEGPYPVISASGVHGSHDEFKARGPGVLTGRSGTIGQVHLVFEDHWPLNTTLYVKEFKRSGPAYALLLLRKLDLASSGSGSAVPTLNRNHIHGAPVASAPQALMDRFEKMAMTKLRAAENLRRQCVSLAAARDLLFPRLISGELSVGAASRELEAAA